MYSQYFGFQKPPFKITPDSGFFYTNTVFLNAHNSLLDAIDEERGLSLLTGAAGTGKTTLLARLAQDLDDTVHFIYLQNSNLGQHDFVSRLSDKLGIAQSDQQPISVEAEIFRLRDHLKVLHDREQGCVLFIDDAQNLPQETLNTLPLLIKADGGANQLQVVLSGSEELVEQLNGSAVSAVLRLVEAHARLDRLSAAEIPAFIDHQIRVAGSMRSDIFSEGAIREIVQTTSGRPSDLNKVCDKALEIAYRQGTQVVTREIIRQTSSAAWLTPEAQPAGEPQRPSSVRRLAEKFRPSGGRGERLAVASLTARLAALWQRALAKTTGLGRSGLALSRAALEKSGIFSLVALAKAWRLASAALEGIRATASAAIGRPSSEARSPGSGGGDAQRRRRPVWIAAGSLAVIALLVFVTLPAFEDENDQERQTAAAPQDAAPPSTEQSSKDRTPARQTVSANETAEGDADTSRTTGRHLTALAELRAQIAQLNLDLRTISSNRDYLKRLVGNLTIERDELTAELSQLKFENQKLQLTVDAKVKQLAELERGLALAQASEKTAADAQTTLTDSVDASVSKPLEGSESSGAVTEASGGLSAVKVSNPGPSTPFAESTAAADAPMDYIRDGNPPAEQTNARLAEETPSEQTGPGIVQTDDLAITPVAAQVPDVEGLEAGGDSGTQAPKEERKAYSDRAVALLLAKARRLYLKDLLTTPEDNNAYDVYMQILENDPEERRAISGIRRIAGRYLNWAATEENNNNRGKALRYYKKALQVLPDTPEIEQRIAELESGKPLLKSSEAAPVEIADKSEKARARLQSLSIEISERSLLRAVEAGNQEMAELLLDAGISPDAQNVGKQTALLTASINGDEAMTSLLLKRGAKVNKQNNLGRSPLSAAAWNGYSALVTILLEGGAEVEATSKEGWNALMYAAWNGHRATVRALLEHGSRVDAINNQGWTALMNAAWNGHSDTVSVLLEHGANPGYETPSGETALLVASQQGHRETALLLD